MKPLAAAAPDCRCIVRCSCLACQIAPAKPACTLRKSCGAQRESVHRAFAGTHCICYQPAGAATLFIGNSRGFFKYLHEHWPCQLPRLSVLVRGMIRRQQHASIGHLVFCTVLK